MFPTPQVCSSGLLRRALLFRFSFLALDGTSDPKIAAEAVDDGENEENDYDRFHRAPRVACCLAHIVRPSANSGLCQKGEDECVRRSADAMASSVSSITDHCAKPQASMPWRASSSSSAERFSSRMRSKRTVISFRYRDQYLSHMCELAVHGYD